MDSSLRFLNPSEAARRLGVSPKALRLYEQRGLVAPARNAAGWRAWGPEQLARGAQVVALRRLGLSLAQVASVLAGEGRELRPALAAHQAALEAQARALADTLGRVRQALAGLEGGRLPAAGEWAGLLAPGTPQPDPGIEFALPWPWGGELFRLRAIRPLNYIVGPLGSGKTRFGLHLAEVLPQAAFLGLGREEGDVAQRLRADAGLASRVESALAWLVEDGATRSAALTALLAGLEAEGTGVLVVDLVEQGLDQATQQALIAWLRRRGAGARPLFLFTRSSAILDLAAVGTDEAIIFCAANHSPPSYVEPHPGAPGYEALASCLASPEVRSRTEGMVAWLPPRASASGCASTSPGAAAPRA